MPCFLHNCDTAVQCRRSGNQFSRLILHSLCSYREAAGRCSCENYVENIRTRGADAEDGILHVGLGLQHVLYAQVGARQRVSGPGLLELIPQPMTCSRRNRGLHEKKTTLLRCFEEL